MRVAILSICLSVTTILISNLSFSQDSLSTLCIDINSGDFVKNLNKNVYSTYIEKKDKLDQVYSSLQFTPGLIHKKMIPNKYVSKKAILKFSICNSSDSIKAVWFTPGFFYSDIQLYRLKNNTLEKLQNIVPSNPDSVGYRFISLAPKDSATFLCELSFVKTYINSLNPRLIQPQYLDAFVTNLHHSRSADDQVSYIFCGLFLMMMLFSFAGFLQGGSPEFLYYSGYAFFIGLLLLIKALLNFHASTISYFVESYLDFIIQSIGIMFYMLFMRKFLDTKKQYRFLYHYYNTGLILLLCSMVGYTFSHYFTNNFSLENGIENVTKYILIGMILIFMGYSSKKWSNRLLRYLFWGNLFLFIFSLLSMTVITFRDITAHLPGVFTSALFYYELGLFLELALFLMALNYKNRKRIIDETREIETLKSDNQMKEYEKELAILKAQQEERDRISSDMHDELGSGMTAIRLMSEILKNRMKENTPSEIVKISQSANELLTKMNGIIWSMNSENDSLDNLISYLRAYALEYLDGTSILCKMHIPETIPDKKLPGDKRRNVFLCVKETLNNALKHSNASELNIDIEINHSLKIKIADNGVGIDLKNLKKFGNGLKNMFRRMESIGGSFKVENNDGTLTTLELPL